MTSVQSDIFDDLEENKRKDFRQSHEPLAARLLEKGHCSSMIFWGPPGVGKTTLAEIFANAVSAKVERLSAVTSGVKEIRAAIEKAERHLANGFRTVLFVDEVHRFNKAQQDAFLPYIENGTIIFIGATTENPSFELNSAILSRARVYVLKALSRPDLERIIMRAALSPVGLLKDNIVFEEGALGAIADMSGGAGCGGQGG